MNHILCECQRVPHCPDQDLKEANSTALQWTRFWRLNENAADTAIADYINNGYKVILSNQDQWNLNCVTSTWIGEKANNCPQVTPTWENFYSNSPFDILSDQGVTIARSDLVGSQQSSNLRDLVLGGEATLQSHEIDNNGLQSKIWPRLSAFAERLWTDPIDSGFLDTGFTQKRLNIQRTRMVFRGIRVDPLQPEYCMQDESACYSKEQYRARKSPGN
ncbi:probable beta-hexosaminidase fdl [Penaeus monodon]|uniref:probable beta-hexosaminidase fdl n=1 Tax=Penaeus monodon TaxID=6687 RepID=UPI0018A7770D|nr:probable beta-hexosaminidase fdl [Penaeus monodon]